MAGRCKDCGGPSVFDADVGSRICTSCGTLDDPSQSVLTSHLDFAPHGDSTRDVPLAEWNSLRSLRNKRGWNIAGNTKDVRENRNIVAIQKFVHSLASSLGHPGLVPRALTLFAQVREQTPNFRWGHKAKRLAGASLAIALREANKADSLRDISYLITEPHTAVARSFTYIARTLHLMITPSDPTHYLPALQTHLLSLLATASALPANLIESISPLVPNLSGIVRTATSLCSLIYPSSSNDTPTPLSALMSLPNAPTAVAAIILALEAELGRPLPQHSILADKLGARVGAGKAGVMQRYKLISEAVLVGVESVPWLAKHEKKVGRGGKEGRSKVPKAVVVVQGLKDVVRFWEDIWREAVQVRDRAEVEFEGEEGDGESCSGDESVGSWVTTESGSSGSARSVGSGDMATAGRKRKRGSRKLTEASQYLLDPLSTPIPGSSKSKSKSKTESVDPSAQLPVPHPAPGHGSSDADAEFSPAHLLTAHVSSLHAAPPTRLQILALERGGEAGVLDEELFGEGELEGWLRTGEEVEVARRMMDLSDAGERGDTGEDTKGRKRRKGGEDGGKGTRRIDMEKLARLLEEPVGSEEEEEEGGAKDKDGECGHVGAGEEVEEVGEWRPLSPGWGGADAGDRYEF